LKGDCAEKRDDFVVVVSRIDSSKKIEHAVKFAKLLKENNIGKGMIIAGNLDPYNYDYYLYLKRMIVDEGLLDYVKFEIDASFDKLISILKKSKVYFHPRPGEHFGMSIVEAMSAGLIPIVSDIGGQTEFVPSKYPFHTLEQATVIASNAFDEPYSERIKISNSVSKFSISNYIKNFQKVVNGMVAK
jgi:glycosyltransferase involved in cell wall biosynthesis